ncbi:hypothetical protein HU200_025420 [Digitaria exilis]|uniref:UDP-glucose 6-dehydrogenase n=1 Tax=Digitaria exilis TaxID=1010633 RepID=A0A835C292_9POAL|nr:hypothetical protein HU200_025420 [Digitaria exilis]
MGNVKVVYGPTAIIIMKPTRGTIGRKPGARELALAVGQSAQYLCHTLTRCRLAVDLPCPSRASCAPARPPALARMGAGRHACVFFRPPQQQTTRFANRPARCTVHTAHRQSNTVTGQLAPPQITSRGSLRSHAPTYLTRFFLTSALRTRDSSSRLPQFHFDLSQPDPDLAARGRKDRRGRVAQDFSTGGMPLPLSLSGLGFFHVQLIPPRHSVHFCSAEIVFAVTEPKRDHVAKSDKIVVEKSTVPVKTAEAIEKILTHNSKGIKFQILSNPEFLAEGTTIEDLFKPDHVLIGGRETPEGQKAVKALKDVYANWVPEDQVAYAVGKDSKIGPKFLNASVGFGGSCFQKDILNLVANYWKQVIKINDYQKSRFKIVVLGFAFKKDTGDTRETAAIDVCKELLGDKAKISIYDPQVTEEQIQRDLAMNKFDWDHPIHLQPMSPTAVKQVSVTWDAYEATKGAHGICILTEWDEFKTLDYKKIYDSMQKPAFLFDGRNVIDAEKMREIGFIVYSIGKPLDPWLKDMPAVA